MSTAKKKTLPAPAGSDDIAAALRRRVQTSTTSGDTPRTNASNVRPGGAVRRSWYMTTDTADTLAALVDDLHYTTRSSKIDVLAALVNVARAHHDEIAARLRAQPEITQ